MTHTFHGNRPILIWLPTRNRIIVLAFVKWLDKLYLLNSAWSTTTTLYANYFTMHIAALCHLKQFCIGQKFISDIKSVWLGKFNLLNVCLSKYYSYFISAWIVYYYLFLTKSGWFLSRKWTRYWTEAFQNTRESGCKMPKLQIY